MRFTLLAVALGVALPVAACGSSNASTFTDGSNDAGGGGADGSSPFADGGETEDGGGVLTTDVDVVITTDNAFSFGYGNATELDTFVQGVPSNGPGSSTAPSTTARSRSSSPERRRRARRGSTSSRGPTPR